MTNSRKDWFPTPIWHFNLDNCDRLNNTLIQEIKIEQQHDRQGRKQSNVLGWHSANDLHQRASFTEFTKIISEHVLEVATCLHWDLAKISLEIDSCWAIVNGKLASNSVHNHPNSVLSGVYYLQAPENSGVISFSDPRPAAQVLVPPITEFSPWTLPKISYKPQVGTMLIFPSWLLHNVEMNLSGELRISLSFNVGMLQLVK
ncbi:TIGR02466 family protein [Chamaesiphon sp. VAR_69_metabat_338]|uniref:TIGR02466 family protein n=1 Tax=Chamaesiphon sp. VAR_69_metabat_338 TaxID=2964704 RepID=UPI00286DF943|nr:TIGR02466 family protein [Chamaesiphon sp. VAR_69_metabat_338]